MSVSVDSRSKLCCADDARRLFDRRYLEFELGTLSALMYFWKCALRFARHCHVLQAMVRTDEAS